MTVASTYRTAIFLMIVTLSFCLPGLPAYAQGDKAAPAAATEAQAFIDRMGQEAIAFLGNPDLSHEEKQRRFRELLNRHFAMETIGRFTIGTYWRDLSTQQQAEYQDLFKDMVVEVYSQRFSDYQGQEFRVADTRTSGDDIIVHSFIVPQSGRNIPVNWQVRKKDGRFQIVDVVIEEVSMAITKRAEFASIIQRGGGDADVLLGHLRDRQSG